MEKVIMFLADGFEEIETITIADVLRRGGVNIETMSINNNKIVKGAHNINVEADNIINKNDLSECQMIILPGGGLGTENLKKSELVNEVVQYFCNNNKYVAAICAAPTVLGVKGILKGKKAVCYPGMESQLQGASVSKENVVKDENIITSKGPATAMEFSFFLLKLLKGENICQSVKSEMLYNWIWANIDGSVFEVIFVIPKKLQASSTISLSMLYI